MQSTIKSSKDQNPKSIHYKITSKPPIKEEPKSPYSQKGAAIKSLTHKMYQQKKMQDTNLEIRKKKHLLAIVVHFLPALSLTPFSLQSKDYTKKAQKLLKPLNRAVTVD